MHYPIYRHISPCIACRKCFVLKKSKCCFGYISERKAVGPSYTDSSKVKTHLRLHHILKLFFHVPAKSLYKNFWETHSNALTKV